MLFQDKTSSKILIVLIQPYFMSIINSQLSKGYAITTDGRFEYVALLTQTNIQITPTCGLIIAISTKH